MNKKNLFLTCGGALLTIALFQNCGIGKSAGGSSFSNSILMSADAAWTTVGLKPEVNEYSRVERWPSLRDNSFSLYPPFRPSSTILNYDKSGTYDGDYVRLLENEALNLSSTDTNRLSGDRFTVVLLIKNLTFPAGGNNVARLFGLSPTGGEQTGYLVIDASQDQTGRVRINPVVWFDGTNHSVSYGQYLSAADARKPLAIVVRFDKDPANVRMAINGQLSDPAVVVGSPPPLPTVNRNLQIHAPDGQFGSGGEFSLKDIAITKKSASDAELAGISTAFEQRAHGVLVNPITIGGYQPGMTDGQALYQQHCASCHGLLTASAKRGLTLARLNTAIASQAPMLGLVTLTDAERQAIVDALR